VWDEILSGDRVPRNWLCDYADADEQEE